jgi:hypothetical protein
MAILGNNVSGTKNEGGAAGRMLYSKFTLASAASLQELHAWIAFGTAGSTIRVVIYKHLSGSNSVGSTLVAYTNPIAVSGSSTPADLSQTGFSVPLPAGDYWIGVRINVDAFVRGATGLYEGINSGASDPPPSTLPTQNASGATTIAAWAVTGAPLSTFVSQIIMVG